MHQIQIQLSTPQKKKLMMGQKVRVKASAVGAGTTVHLTDTQMRKIQKALSQSKGFDLQFSQTQAEQHMKSGAGFKDVLMSGVRGLARAGEYLAPKALDLASSFAKKGTDKLIGRYISNEDINKTLSDVVRSGIDLGNKLSQDQVAGLLQGLSQTKSGSGLFSFIPGVGEFLNKVGNTAIDVGLPIAGNIAGSMIQRRFGGAMRGPGRGRMGGGLYLPQ